MLPIIGEKRRHSLRLKSNESTKGENMRLAPITEAEVKEFAKDWYHKLDIHVPLEEFVPMPEQGRNGVPEATVYGFEGFKGWYERHWHLLMKFTP